MPLLPPDKCNAGFLEFYACFAFPIWQIVQRRVILDVLKLACRAGRPRTLPPHVLKDVPPRPSTLHVENPKKKKSVKSEKVKILEKQWKSVKSGEHCVRWEFFEGF